MAVEGHGPPLQSTDAVGKAPSERRERERPRHGVSMRLADRLEQFGRECTPLPDCDTRSPDQIAMARAACGADGRGEAARDRLEPCFRLTGSEIVAVTPQQAEIAVDALRRFGGGRLPAALNIGGCFSYALAIASDDCERRRAALRGQRFRLYRYPPGIADDDGGAPQHRRADPPVLPG
jgi:uncharacterized protein with PIN domain